MNTITGMSNLTLHPPASSTEIEKTGSAFSEILKTTISEIDNQQKAADLSAQKLHAGGAKNLHETMIVMEQANISLRLLVQMRNKAMEAYQEVMRTQV
jgi:flagellar hook-basal body complex protein FliE